MDAPQKVNLVLEIITKSQDWRDRPIVASVIAKFPIDNKDKWMLAEKLARQLQTAGSLGERRHRILERQTEINGVDLWALGWLVEQGIVGKDLYGFQWLKLIAEFQDTVDSDMQQRRVEVENASRTKATEDLACRYNKYIGGEAFTPVTLFKIITNASRFIVGAEESASKAPVSASGNEGGYKDIRDSLSSSSSQRHTSRHLSANLTTADDKDGMDGIAEGVDEAPGCDK